MKKSKISIFIVLFLIFTIAYPIFIMLMNSDLSSFKELVQTNSFKIAIKNSLFVTTISTVISVIIGFLLAYAINRTKIKQKKLLILLLTIPMLIPSISHGVGIINLFGTNGIISSLFNFNVIGKVGIILGSVMYSFPIAFLMINDGFNYINISLYDLSKVIGLNKWQTFKKITLVYLKKPLLSAIFAVFTMIFTDYGVALSVGGKYLVLPVYLYKEVIGLLDFQKGILISLFLLIPAIISFIIDILLKDYNSNLYNKGYEIKDNKRRDILFGIFTYTVIIFIFIVIGSFVYYAFIDNPHLNKTISLIHFKYVLDDGIIKYIFNSLLIAISVSIIGTIISYIIAYYTSRIRGKLTRIVHILTIASLSIPGIVLGISYVVCFKDSLIYNTFIILIIVNIVHFIATPYLLAYNALNKLNDNYEVIAKTCNISLFRLLKDIIVPNTKNTITEMFSYFFVNSMITISAVAFLFSVDTMPVSLMINKYEGNLMLGEAAIVSLVILVINLSLKIATTKNN